MSSAEDGHRYDQPSHKHVSRPLQRETRSTTIWPAEKDVTTLQQMLNLHEAIHHRLALEPSRRGFETSSRCSQKPAERTDSRASLPHRLAAPADRSSRHRKR